MLKFVLLGCLFVQCALSLQIKRTNTPEAKLPISAVYDSGCESVFYVDYGVDSQETCLFRYDTKGKKTYSAYVRGPSYGNPTFIVPIKKGKHLSKYAVGFKESVCVVAWDGTSSDALVVDEIYNARDRLGPNERIYLGHRDPTGRALYAGTIDMRYCGAPANQSIYVTRRGSPRSILFNKIRPTFGYGFANGRVYFLDSCALKIWSIPDPDSKTHCKGNCHGEEVLIDFTKFGKTLDDFVPVGLEPNSKGNLLTVNNIDGCIYEIDTTRGTCEKKAQLPVKLPNSLTYADDNKRGGQNLYVTVESVYRDTQTGSLTPAQSPGCALYKIEDTDSGVEFSRLKVDKSHGTVCNV